ncbi:hypothetical protein ABFT80_25175 [Mesorhizobium sp. SB112]|uniref:hypothetical protein n=1 Tax=Mesorhizobium sp. SB112 TaxID=3151853 RepID=UPI0032648B4C
MQLRQIEEMLRRQLDEEQKKEADAQSQLVAFFEKAEKRYAEPAVSRIQRDDIIIAALGIALGLTCALFPWYIFFNQEKFGVRAMKFDGAGIESTPSVSSSSASRITPPMADTDKEYPIENLDLFATGTLPLNRHEKADIEATKQPFPSEILSDFRLVHVANGRAMIEDSSGLWMVRRGSTLPDNSRVSRIELRSGHWVIVTNSDKIIEMSE